MGQFAGKGQATPLEEGRQFEVWAAETVAAGSTSAAVKLARGRGIAYPSGFSVELAFGGAPGAFEVDILTADTDDITRYVKRGSLTQANINSYNVARAEFTSVWCRFVALQMVSLANAVGVTGLVTR